MTYRGEARLLLPIFPMCHTNSTPTHLCTRPPGQAVLCAKPYLPSDVQCARSLLPQLFLSGSTISLVFSLLPFDFFPPSLIFNTFSVSFLFLSRSQGVLMLDTPAISCSLGSTWQQTFPCSTTAEKNAYFYGPHSNQQDVHVMH